MENTPNTLWVKAYTPLGFQVGITLAIGSLDDIVTADDLQAALTAKGYLIAPEGVDPEATTEVITHVSCRMKRNADNTLTPHIAFYHENPKMIHRYASVYLNTDEDKQLFEKAMGVTIASLPARHEKNHPERDLANLHPHIVALPKPTEIYVKPKEYTKDDGTKGTTQDFANYVGVTGSQDDPENKTWSKAEINKFWEHWNGLNKLTKEHIYAALGVDTATDWQGTKTEADERVQAYIQMKNLILPLAS